MLLTSPTPVHVTSGFAVPPVLPTGASLVIVPRASVVPVTVSGAHSRVSCSVQAPARPSAPTTNEPAAHFAVVVVPVVVPRLVSMLSVPVVIVYVYGFAVVVSTRSII